MKKLKWFISYYLYHPYFRFDVKRILPNTANIFWKTGLISAIKYFKFSVFYTFYKCPNQLYRWKTNKQKRLMIIEDAKIDRFISYLQNNIDKLTYDELLTEIQIGAEDIAVNSYFRRTRL